MPVPRQSATGRPRADLASASRRPATIIARAKRRDLARVANSDGRVGDQVRGFPRVAREVRDERDDFARFGSPWDADTHLVKGPSAGRRFGSGARETPTRGGGDPLVATPDIPVRPFFMGAELRKGGRHTSTTSRRGLATYERGSRLEA